MRPDQIRVNSALDTGRADGLSHPATTLTVLHPSSLVPLPRVRIELPKLRTVAADLLEVAVEDVELADGQARIVGVPDSGMSIGRVAAATTGTNRSTGGLARPL